MAVRTLPGRRAPAARVRYPYEPHPKQAQAHAFDYVEEVLFGGTLGPGKTEWLLAEVLKPLFRFPGSAGVIFRRTFPDLSRPGGIILRLLERLGPLDVGTYHASAHTWTLRNGSVLELAHLERDSDVTKYLGAEYIVEAFDQLEQFTEYQYRTVRTRLRASGELAAALQRAEYIPRTASTANPGGVGHTWVKARFIDPAPPGVPFYPESTEDELEPVSRVFIQALPGDNPSLDEGYYRRLRNLPADQRRALLEGDWDAMAGARFGAFRRAVNVVNPEDFPLPPPGAASRAAGVDYGFDAPWCALWGAKLPDNLVVVYRELYGPGLTPTEQAEAFLDAEADGERAPGRPLPVFADPSTWGRSLPTVGAAAGGGKVVGDVNAPPRGSIAWYYRAAGLPVTKATNDRITGVTAVDEALRVRGDGRPRLLIYSTCRNLIRTLPGLPRSKTNPEDIDTHAEDHAYDALRYLLLGLLGRPDRPGITPPQPRRPPPGAPAGLRPVTGGVREMGF